MGKKSKKKKKEKSNGTISAYTKWIAKYKGREKQNKGTEQIVIILRIHKEKNSKKLIHIHNFTKCLKLDFPN